MLFILDAIQCAVEEAVLFAEEKIALCQEKMYLKRISRSEDEEDMDEDESLVEEERITENSMEDENEIKRTIMKGDR